jgi:glycosyltransferase involved in cell wall biosynthesis
MSSVLFLTQTHTPWGGMEWWVEEFGAWLQNRGWDVHAALAKGARFSDPAPYKRLHPSLPTVIMDASVGTESARVRAVLGAIEKTRPDIVIPVGIGASYAAMRESKRGVRFVVPVLSYFPDTLANIIDNADIVDAAVANARLLLRFLQPHLGDRAHYVLQGVKPPLKYARSNSPKLRAGFVGRLEQASKRVFDLIDLPLGDDIELHIWGDGPDRDALQRALPHTIFHGFADKARLYEEAYPNLDVLLLMSEAEGSPNVVWEAMHHGVVPVVSRFLGIEAEGVLRSESNSMIFDVGDMQTAAAYLQRLQNDRELLARLSQQARKDMTEWTDTRMHEGWTAVLEQVLEREPLTPRARNVEQSPAGRLDRLFPSFADRVRAITGRRFPHRSGWEEWPGSEPVSAERAESIAMEVRRLQDLGATPAPE